MELATHVDYPIVAITDLHGQRTFLERLLARLATLPEWPDCWLVFLGDYCDRGADVKGTVERILELVRRRGRVTAVRGNHDQAPTRAARLDDGPRSPFWIHRYQERYDYRPTFQSYLGRPPRPDNWEAELEAFRQAVPPDHRDFFASLRWVVEAPGHLFLHCGLSPELEASPEEQLRALHARRWDRALLRPRRGTRTADLWAAEYPVWLGADKFLSDRPLPYPGKVQVTGHVLVAEPEVNAVRIRLDTSGGLREPLTACLLRSATAAPVFIRSTD